MQARVKQVIEVGGLKFRDSDGNGKLTPYQDWRLTPAERTRDLLGRMSSDEKLGLLLIMNKFMGACQPDPELTSHNGVIDEEAGEQPQSGFVPGTPEIIKDRHIRHLILREQVRPSRIAGSFDFERFKEAYPRGLISDQRLDEAAGRLLQQMFELGLFDNPYVDPAVADVALLYVNPFTGDYFKSVGLLDLTIHEATNVNLPKIRRLREQVDQVVVALNVFLPWVLTELEPLADAMVAGFETDESAILEVVLGEFAPVGKMPLTMPASEEAIAVDENDLCASPNDVPGYDKEKYTDGRPYVYVDTDGNRYELGHGLSY